MHSRGAFGKHAAKLQFDLAVGLTSFSQSTGSLTQSCRYGSP